MSTKDKTKLNSMSDLEVIIARKQA